MTDSSIKQTHGVFQDLTGRQFGRWTVVRFAGIENKCTKWQCICECGTERKVAAGSLKNGISKSCGCLSRDLASKRLYKHGCAIHGNYTSEFNAWMRMRNRIVNPNNNRYHRYGGRGIKVCERWASFEMFLADMGPRPSPKHSIDRIDNNGDYCPENCKWSTNKEQNRNKSTNRVITFEGKTLTAAEWAEVTGIKGATIRARIRNGWSAEKALQMAIYQANGQVDLLPEEYRDPK